MKYSLAYKHPVQNFTITQSNINLEKDDSIQPPFFFPNYAIISHQFENFKIAIPKRRNMHTLHNLARRKLKAKMHKIIIIIKNARMIPEHIDRTWDSGHAYM